MATITHDQLHCDVNALGRWVADLVGRPFWSVGIPSLVLAHKAIEVAKATKACMYSCPAIDSEKSCLNATISDAHELAIDFRKLARGSRLFSIVTGKKLIRAAEAWEDVVEYAEDIQAMIDAEKEHSASIPWTQVKAELGL